MLGGQNIQLRCSQMWVEHQQNWYSVHIGSLGPYFMIFEYILDGSCLNMNPSQLTFFTSWISFRSLLGSQRRCRLHRRCFARTERARSGLWRIWRCDTSHFWTANQQLEACLFIALPNGLPTTSFGGALYFGPETAPYFSGSVEWTFQGPLGVSDEKPISNQVTKWWSRFDSFDCRWTDKTIW